MNLNTIPISTLFVGLNGFVALALSYIVVMERTRKRVWHGESKQDVTMQIDPLANPTAWVSTVETMSKKLSTSEVGQEGTLQRKVRAHGNFVEYVPLGLLFIVALELMRSPIWLLWLLGSTLTLARIIYAWGVIKTYGPSISRAIGFFATWFVYIVGSSACIYYGLQGLR
ncbi:MAPEG family protein [Aliterella atlantica]|uniref:Glutathione S-transferase n=1 Tax=Aliterella atlantica CENA595 TaxID=1618023 RepID=A0A0D8ZV55_9CYAN|nr:MAPEG family protein [Aliterella atlantica]KJH72620.1 glutathione S-transferase [Aliterella atlantica CENA595]